MDGHSLEITFERDQWSWLGELMLKPGILVQAICLHITDLAMYPVSGGGLDQEGFLVNFKMEKMIQNEKNEKKERK